MKKATVIGAPDAAQSLRDQGYEVEEHTEPMTDRAVMSALLRMIQHTALGDDVAFVFCGTGRQLPAKSKKRGRSEPTI